MALHFADLHLHSKYSRAVSPLMDLEHLRQGALEKGLSLLGSGDFTHPSWYSELRQKLETVPGQDGIFRLRGDASGVRFLLQTEVATFYSDHGRPTKLHHLLYAPSLEIVSQLNDLLSKRGNLSADGRPMFAKMSGAELVELCIRVSPEIQIIPAHAWTPWFGVLGSHSGFASIADGYGDQHRHIRAFETGMSSDPAMNWRVSSLDAYAQLSNSDSHSPYAYRIGRECNVFDFADGQLSYSSLFAAINKQDRTHFKFTVEVDPNYGKYHYDGHRACGFSCAPSESARLKNQCPVCKRPLTIGVLNRVEALADRPEGFVPQNAIPFKTLLPLQELASAALGVPLASKKASEATAALISKFGNELFVLLAASPQQLADATGPLLAQAILANRDARLRVTAGFDGEYGVLQFGPKRQAANSAKASASSPSIAQKGLGDFS